MKALLLLLLRLALIVSHADPGRGVAAAEIPEPAIQWSAKVQGAGREIRNTYYSPSTDTLFALSTFGSGAAIHHIDPATGEEIFTFPIPPVEAAPATTNGSGIASEGDEHTAYGYANVERGRPHFSDGNLGVYEPEGSGLEYLVVSVLDGDKDGRLISYNPKKKQLNWEVPTPSPPGWDYYHMAKTVGIPPISADGTTIYAAQPHGRVMAVEAKSGQIQWEATNNTLAQVGGLALNPDETTLYIGSRRSDGIGSAGIYAISTEDGTEGTILQKYLTGQFSPGGINSEPALTKDGDAIVVSDRNLGLCRYDTSNLAGGQVWVNAFGDGSQYTPYRPVLSMSDEIYANARYNIAHITTNGDTVWKDDWSADGTLRATPILSPDEVYVYVFHRIGSSFSKAILRKVNAATGEIIWELPTDTGGLGDMSINADGTTLYFGDDRGQVWAVDTINFATPAPTAMPSSRPTAATESPSSVPTSSVAKSCINSGGFVATRLCCKWASDFPDTCTEDVCACTSLPNLHYIDLCICPMDFCFDGAKCVESTPSPTSVSTSAPTSAPTFAPTILPTEVPVTTPSSSGNTLGPTQSWVMGLVFAFYFVAI